ncbi:MAG: DUF3025 domain-containing protein [Betaproteobacteria bacterium]|nr:MAG: DUF3025 domain-containing protein [Betaproteobacteria bacterium]
MPDSTRHFQTVLLTHPAFASFGSQEASTAPLSFVFGEQTKTLRFIEPPPRALSAIDFERRIVEHGEIIVRPDNLHDAMNALVWRAFPKTKFAISRTHVALGETLDGKTRPRRRDVLTLFDEAGLIVLCERDELRMMNEQHQWKTLFIEHRAEFLRDAKPIIFGHGAMEQLVKTPHRGLTVKALWLPLATTTPLAAIDDYLTARIEQNTLLSADERRTPLPLLGIPGWFVENEDPRCYDDTETFRPLRRTTPTR